MLQIKPEDIEKKSFEILTSQMDKDRMKFYTDDELLVVKRTIHTTADFDYQYNVIFQNNAIETLKYCIQSDAMIFTDTNMALSGINKRILTGKFSITPRCLIAESDTVEYAKKNNTTRATASVDLAYQIRDEKQDLNKGKKIPIVFAVGNAPTALIRIHELLDKYTPDFIIAAPVGFVNVIEAKELIKQSNIPAIICDGNKGGSNVCAAIINAVLLQMV
ncbi:precorrin-8X methylmutase [Lachnoanaerobaculum saburreum]|jgi:Precorrin isomerase|uniref:Precorrin-8X methylmutase n=1 Tax=Lachnoanaerobaculum saburreum TaxID=467210 RepID=A0A133ZN24_9FIRM|nr:precorrin-8X methylmutase [Lachnoanaerobaculum saburreum]KXB56812.1 precorrin-8X methylmutase [Lachnoanaerobaculum saburreum]